jgi:hypothetical protein
MTDRLFTECCYGTDRQHMGACPTQTEHARLALPDTLDLAGYAEDADHLRKPVRVGDVLIPHPVAIAAMLAYAGSKP